MITIKDLMYAAKLRLLREQKNVKQYHAACLVGLECQQHYSNYESGKSHFTEDAIRKICEGFEVPVSEFKTVDYGILNEMIHMAGLAGELQTYIKRLNNKEHHLYLLECEKRLMEIKLENMRKNKQLLELRGVAGLMYMGEVPKIYVMA